MTEIRAVYFDIGETVWNESREYEAWAEWLGIAPHTFFAVLGAVIARGQHHREVFQIFQPGMDIEREYDRRVAAGAVAGFGPADLYPDVTDCLAELRDQGVRVALAGNQPARIEAVLRNLELPVDAVHSSEVWGVEKPDPAYFDRLVADAGHPAGNVLYVGDRLDNDIRPAQQRGLLTALLLRGPWGYILHDQSAANQCLFQLTSLSGLPELVRRHNTTAHAGRAVSR